MASIAKATLSLGLISTTIRVESGVQSQESFKTVCLGQPGKDPHPATAVRKPTTCASCGDLPYGAPLSKARESGGGLVLVTDEELKEAKASHDDKFKGKLDLVAHPATDVLNATAQGEKYYQLVPDGDASRYAVLVRLVADHPELAFTCLFTVRTRASMFVLSARNGVLLAEERVVRERVKPLPQIEAEANEQLLGMADAYLPQLVAPFDPTNYADGYTAAITALIASREAVAQAEGPIATVTPIRATDTDLMAQLAALVPAQPKPKATRKPRAKREPAA